jgi:hypothetical protein
MAILVLFLPAIPPSLGLSIFGSLRRPGHRELSDWGFARAHNVKNSEKFMP